MAPNSSANASAPPVTLAYSPELTEPHWQAAWEAAGAHRPRGEGNKRYILEMWPYPSGDLHMGHVRNYTLGDVFARFARMQGDDVLHPMGWDALGLPAENQAILEKVAPQTRTPQNIARMRQQMQRLGLSYDWQRELTSCQPDYYRWNQWFFVQLLARGLVYRRESQVNWCPGCATILANEQVLADNTCWRGHSGVSQKTIPEWAFRITAYAQELLDGLDTLPAWPDRVVSQQRHWLGRSEGAQVVFEAQDTAGKAVPIEVFTTRVDTLYGATYLVLAPDHPAVTKLTTPEQREAVQAFVAHVGQQDSIARTALGVAKEGVFTGSYATHPITKAALPVWLGNYVLANYGTGAVMAVPAHDERDAAFAKTYDLPVRQVVDGEPGPSGCITEPGTLLNSGEHTGLSSASAKAALAQAAEKGGFGHTKVQWHLRDWGFSRQRYWGTPIPIIYCPEHGAVPVPESELPVLLPDFAEVELTGSGGAPLAKLDSFVNAPCPTCGAPGRREVETMDTFVDSAWYFARFLTPERTSGPVDAAAAAAWLPVDIYVGGPEHAVMHLLYFRFFTRAMRDLGLVSVDEPVRRLLTQGMVNAPAWRCPVHGYRPAQARGADGQVPRTCPVCARPQTQAIEKMSKSKFNGVDPMHLIGTYGADTARLYVLFAAPPEKDLEWNQEGVDGLHRFVQRVWRLGAALGPSVRDANAVASMAEATGTGRAVRQAVHRALSRVGQEMAQRNHFNTCIATLMELTNSLYEHKLQEALPEGVAASVGKEALLYLAQMLAPFAPHLAETLWHSAGGEGLVALSAWPQVDAEALAQTQIRLVVQVGGKLRGQIEVAPDLSGPELIAAARADSNVARYLDGKTVVKEVVVPGRLINFVVRS